MALACCQMKTYLYIVLCLLFLQTLLLFAEASGPYETILKAFLYTKNEIGCFNLILCYCHRDFFIGVYPKNTHSIVNLPQLHLNIA